jgi:DNA primase
MSFDPSHVDVEHFLETLGVEHITRATRSEMRFSCPYPSHGDGDRTPSCYMNLNTAAFFCHGCKERGTAVDMAAYVLQISPLEAIRLLKHAYQPGGLNPDLRKIEEEVRQIWRRKDEVIVQPQLAESLLEKYDVDWYAAHEAWLAGEGFQATDYMFERGFNPLTLSAWSFGYCEKTNRITLPIRDEDGNLIGIKARAPDDRKPKYLVFGDGPGGGPYGFDRYFPSHVVFGADRAKKEIPDCSNPLVVCEGEYNAIACRAGYTHPTVAINGSFFSEWHAKIIKRIAPDQGLILWLDQDSAGQNCVWGWENSRGEWHSGIYELLSPYMPVQLVKSEKDAADSSPEEIQEALSDTESALMARLARA